jgi:hypothetical protein
VIPRNPCTTPHLVGCPVGSLIRYDGGGARGLTCGSPFVPDVKGSITGVGDCVTDPFVVIPAFVLKAEDV